MAFKFAFYYHHTAVESDDNRAGPHTHSSSVSSDSYHDPA